MSMKKTLYPNDRAYAFLAGDSGSYSYAAMQCVNSPDPYAPGTVLGINDRYWAGASIPTNSGTGTGAMTALRFGPLIMAGVYLITLLDSGATAPFSVVAPDGKALADGAVGSDYDSEHVSFKIENGGTMTVGDTYAINVVHAGAPGWEGSGSGTVSNISLGKYAQMGGYVVKFTEGGPSAAYEVYAPNGAFLGARPWDTPFESDHVNFTVGAGSITAGDIFTIVIAHISDAAAMPWNPRATDGSQYFAGICTHEVPADSVNSRPCNALVRQAQIIPDLLTFDAGVSAADKLYALKQMESVNIFPVAAATSAG
jgi:hypothetical protein